MYWRVVRMKSCVSIAFELALAFTLAIVIAVAGVGQLLLVLPLLLHLIGKLRMLRIEQLLA